MFYIYRVILLSVGLISSLTAGIACGNNANYEIYVMNSDGTNQIRLTRDPSTDKEPNWSHHGDKIVFASDREDNDEIYVMNSDGTGQTRLTQNTGTDSSPEWSPDGRSIVFKSQRDEFGNSKKGEGYYSELYLMDFNGDNQTNLTYTAGPDWQPAWAPDGQRISYTTERDEHPDRAYPTSEIYVIKVDGTDDIRLTDHPANDAQSAWSPDGNRIAFTSDRDGNFRIYVMDTDGSNQTALTDSSGSDWEPDWSPDGKRIAFTSNRDGNDEIYVMRADGTGQTRLTNHPDSDHQPNWSPSGLHIIFATSRNPHSKN